MLYFILISFLSKKIKCYFIFDIIIIIIIIIFLLLMIAFIISSEDVRRI